MESKVIFELLNEFKFILILQFFIALVAIQVSGRSPSSSHRQQDSGERKSGRGKKFLWSVSSALIICVITVSLLYSLQIEIRKNSIKLSLIGNQLIEFPNRIEDMNADMYVPFRCLFPEDKIRARFFRINKNVRENINRNIDAHKDPSQAARVSLSNDGEYLWVDGGSADLNIPVSANCIKGGKVQIIVSLYDGTSETYSVPFQFEAMAPVPESRNSWNIESKLTKSGLPANTQTRVVTRAINNGQKGEFEFSIEVLDPESLKPIPASLYQMTRPNKEVRTIQHGRSLDHEWPISFTKAGRYLVSTCVKKQIGFYNLQANRKTWGDSFNYQTLFVTVSGNPDRKRIQQTAPKDFTLSFITETSKNGATLFEEPSETSRVVATRIRKGAAVKVFGQGLNASEVIINSDEFVKVDVINLKKSGYIAKNYLSD